MKNSSTIVLRIAIKNKPLMMSGGVYRQIIVPFVMLITQKGGRHNELEAA